MEDACLPAVLPAGIALAEVLDSRAASDRGAAPEQRDAAETEPLVEISDLPGFVGGAPWSVISLGRRSHAMDGRGSFVRAAYRVLNAVRVRGLSLRARRLMSRKGYGTIETLYWDRKHTLVLPGVARPARRLRERLPQRAFVVGRRGPDRPTVLEDVIDAAGDRIEGDLRPLTPLVKSGQLIVLSEYHVLRTAIGPGADRIDRHVEHLSTLSQLGLPGATHALLPDLIAHGRTGAARWSVEERLPGTPVRSWTSELLAEALDFLVHLHGSGGVRPARLPSADAHIVGRYGGGSERQQLLALGRWADARVAGLPGGWAHGDFHRGNLLCEDGRLRGVIDWDSAGPGRLPLLDLAHLHLDARGFGRSDEWGSRIIDVLVPWARDGGDDVSAAYCRRIGISTSAETLLAVVIAYWLDRASYQLEGYADRVQRRRWMAGNLAHPLRRFTSLVPE